MRRITCQQQSDFIMLRGKWGAYGAVVHVLVRVLVIIGAAYLVYDYRKCDDETFVRSVQGFLILTFAYLLYEVVQPLGLFALANWLKMPPLSALKWLHYYSFADVIMRLLFFIAFVTLFAIAIKNICRKIRPVGDIRSWAFGEQRE